MTRLWISDFRGKPLQFWFNNANLLEDTELENNENEDEKEPATEVEPDSDSSESVVVLPENTFLYEENADQSWLDTYITQQLLILEDSDLDVIILLGFNDCVYSCTWNTLDINKIAKDYCLTLNKLKEQFKDVEFYFCSVNPVDNDYLKMNSKGTFISKEDLNNKIKEFNGIVKKESKVNYIDSFTYFEETGFKTRDGVRYTPETCIDLQKFIENKIKVDSTVSISGTPTNFKLRTTAPSKDNKHYYSNENPYHKYGFGMPNCTAYAWGRFYEILGTPPKLSPGIKSAGAWYHESDGYERGKDPRVGSVICWDVDGGGGHVAIVEEIESDTKIWISQSAWGGFIDGSEWKYSPIEKSGDVWFFSSGYDFQGFIYNPAVTSTGATIVETISKSEVINRSDYLGSEEQKINARYIWQYLGSRGWTLNAVAALIGNMVHESGLTPNRYEEWTPKGVYLDYYISKSLGHPTGYPTEKEIEDYFNMYKSKVGRFPGCGLTGWTWDENGYDPDTWDGNKYISWCKKRNLDFRDIDSGLERIIWECDNGVQFHKSTAYPITFKEFRESTKPVRWLAEAFLDNYENPLYMDFEGRGSEAETWYKFLLPYAPGAFIAESLSLTNLKTTAINPTQASFSFITKLAKKGTYKITSLADSKTEVDKADLPIKADEKPKETEEKEINSSEKIITFNSNSKLKPNTEYKILIEIEGESEKDKLSDTLYFKTPQDFPDVISDVEINLKEKNLLNLSLTVKTKPISYWGYWGNIASGYTIYLIVNGKKIASKELSTLENSFDVNLKDYFTESFAIKLDDCIQIGILAWVKDDNGKRVYKKTAAKASNVINLLNQSFIAYLNID